MNIEGKSCSDHTTKYVIWPFLVDHCIHTQVEVTTTTPRSSTKFLLEWSPLHVEYTDLPSLEGKSIILIQYSTSAFSEIFDCMTTKPLQLDDHWVS